MIFDTHAHYDSRQFDGDREEVLAALPGAGIGGLMNIGADLAGTEASLALAERYPFVWAAAGVHPDCVDELEELGEETAAEQLRGYLKHPRCRAAGEIGLDYHGDYPDKTPRAL